jgi:hypothetical protein
MTMTDTRDTRDIAGGAPDCPVDVGGAAEAQRIARQLWRAAGRPDGYGATLGRLVRRADGTARSERWGRKQVEAARAEDAGGAGVVVPLTPTGTVGGTPPTVLAAQPAVPVPGRNGTHVPAARRNGAGQAARGRPPAEAEPARAPVPHVVLTGVAVALVTAVCAVVSYSHIRHLADVAGMGHAAVLPLALDGMVVACAGSLLVDRRRGQRGSRAARAGLVIGLVASIMANAVAVDPTLAPLRFVRFVLAVYPPLALGLSLHVFDRVFRR